MGGVKGENHDSTQVLAFCPLLLSSIHHAAIADGVKERREGRGGGGGGGGRTPIMIPPRT